MMIPMMMTTTSLVYFRGWDDSNEMPLALRSLASIGRQCSELETPELESTKKPEQDVALEN